MTEDARMRRKQLDHERYMRNRDERLKRWHDYYDMNRENIILKNRKKGLLKYGTIKNAKCYDN